MEQAPEPGSPPPPGREMEVEVVDDLTALRPGIAREAISALAVARALRQESRHAHAMPHDRLVASLEPRDRLDVPLGNDQQVDRRLGVEVLEGEDQVVLVFDVGRAFPGSDAAEGAAVAHRPLRLVYTCLRGRVRPR